MKASDLFVRALENEGVKYIFGIPGEENLDLLESLKTSSIQMIVTRHEQAAGFMAATVGRLTGKPGVCLSTLGPGATNFTTPAAYAELGRMPMVMITGQKPIKKSKQGKFQIIDVVAMMQPITKSAKQITHGNRIPMMVRDAFRLAMGESPGATHLELPEDIAREETDTETAPISIPNSSVASNEGLQTIKAKLESAKRPLVLIGAAANQPDASSALTKFIEKTGLYFFNTQMGKGAIDERHEKYLGTAALSSKDSLHAAIKKADLILSIGHNSVEKPPFIMSEVQAEVIHLHTSPAEVDAVYFPQMEVIGDIAKSIEKLTTMMEPPSQWEGKEFEATKNKLDQFTLQGAEINTFPVAPQRIVSTVRNVMPDDGIVALDNGMYKLWFAKYYKTHQPQTLLLDNALASMGAGLPSAMASKLLHPNKKVLAICGDGGFMMNSQEIETALRLNLDLVVMIVRDDAYGMIKWKQDAMKLTDFGLNFGNPDFIKYAESYGAKGERVESIEEFQPKLESVLHSKGVTILEVPIDYTQNKHLTQPN